MKTDLSMYGADESIPLEFKVGDTLSPSGRDIEISAIYKDRVVLSLIPSCVTITQESDDAVDAETERCCKDICEWCKQGDALVVNPTMPGFWHHDPRGGFNECEAAAIRARKERHDGR